MKNLKWILPIIVIYAAIVSGVWSYEGHIARMRGAEAAKQQTVEALDGVDFIIEPETFRAAQLFIDRTADIAAASRTDLAAAARSADVDFVAVVDTNGVIIAANRPALVGFDMHKDVTPEGEDPFTSVLEDGVRYCAQCFRRPPAPADDGHYYKFVALAYPKGGFLLVGDGLDDYRTKRDYAFEQQLQDWHAGLNGFYLLVDRSTGVIVSGVEASFTGKTLAEAGLADVTFTDETTPVRANVFNLPAFVYRLRPEFGPFDIYIVQSVDDIVRPRNVATIAVTLALGFVFLVGGLLFAKILRQGRRLAEYHAKEDENRQRDLALANNIQMSALPSIFPPYPDRPEIDLYAAMHPAREVGGDFFDFPLLDDRRLLVVVADVSGKGIPAAMFMMKAKTEIHAATAACRDLAEAVRSVNNTLSANNTANMFVTAWIGVLNLDTGVLEYVSAGHNPPLVRHADGSAVYLNEHRAGLILGAMEGVPYTAHTVPFTAGDTLFLYTDGVTEATNAAEELYGEKRLQQCVVTAPAAARELCGRVAEDVNAFAAGAPQADDITVLALRYRGK